MSLAQMSNAISLTPGFSPVTVGKTIQNRFNGFPRAGKPLKRLVYRNATSTRLKPGVNESD
jgi:hypothetical protein